MPNNEQLSFNVSFGGAVKASASTNINDTSRPTYEYLLVSTNPSSTNITEIDISTYNLGWYGNATGTTNKLDSVDEGQHAYLVVKTTNVPDGTVLNVTLSGDVSVADLAEASLSTTITVTNNIAHRLYNTRIDQTTEGNETLIATCSVNSTVIGSTSIKIIDTSLTTSYSYNVYDSAGTVVTLIDVPVDYTVTSNGDYQWVNGPETIIIGPNTTKYISVYPAGLSLVNGADYDGGSGGITGFYLGSSTIRNDGYLGYIPGPTEPSRNNHTQSGGGARSVVLEHNPDAYIFCWLPGWNRFDYDDVYDPYGGMFKWGTLNETKWYGPGWKSNDNKNSMLLDTTYTHAGVKVTNVSKLESLDWDKFEIGFAYKIKVENTTSGPIELKALYGQYSTGYPDSRYIQHGVFGGGDYLAKNRLINFSGGNRSRLWGGSKLLLSCDGFMRVSDN